MNYHNKTAKILNKKEKLLEEERGREIRRLRRQGKEQEKKYMLFKELSFEKMKLEGRKQEVELVKLSKERRKGLKRLEVCWDLWTGRG